MRCQRVVGLRYANPTYEAGCDVYAREIEPQKINIGAHTMNLVTLLNVLAASNGMIGSILLYKGSFSFEAPAVYADEKFLNDMAKRNKRRQLIQRAGMIFLFIGFLLQCIAQFVPSQS